MKRISNNSKKWMALAMGVSLWLAGGSLLMSTASAENQVINGDGNDVHITTNKDQIQIKGNNNTVTIDEGVTVTAVLVDPGKTGNTIIIKGIADASNTDQLRIRGGESDTTVSVSGNVQGGIYGGLPGTEGTGNKINISGGTVTVISNSNHNSITGGLATGTINTSNNEVNISGGTVTATGTSDDVGIRGGAAVNGNANSNKIKISGGTVEATKIYGGYTAGSGNASNNEVEVTNVTVSGVVAGGYSSSGNEALNNTVTIEGGTFNGDIYGGKVGGTGSLASNNTVNINGGNFGANVNIYGGDGTGAARNNTVNISGGTFDESVKIYGGMNTAGAAHDNVVKISKQGLKVDDIAVGEGTGNKLVIDTTGVEVTGASGGGAYANEIVIGPNVNHTAGAKVLKSRNFGGTYGVGLASTLDISGATKLADATDGTMTLLESSTANDFDGLQLKYSGGTATLNDSNLTQIVKSGVPATTTPVSGVTVDYSSTHTVSLVNLNNLTKNGVNYSVASTANKLTFGNVSWLNSGALLDHSTTLSGMSFAGAAVDTSNINFTNVQELDANKSMTLVSSFGNSVGTITGSKYKVGSGLVGDGTATLVDSDNDGVKDALIFTTTTAAKDGGGTSLDEMTHNTVMGMEAGMATLSVGNDFIDSATEGLGNGENAGLDGLATYAKLGGGTMRQETGSHVNTHNWNAILALGHKNVKKLSTTEYGAFFEYGTASYTTFNGNERGDGSTHYTGGGLLGKWQQNDGFYVEGSLRVGSVHDDANNLLRNNLGVPYSYDTDATYWGAHLGVGKEFIVNNTDTLDVYAKYFYNHRGSVSFDAGGRYDLDGVNSNILRIGTRYTVKKNEKFNYYGGLAVEHEFSGNATGTYIAPGGAIGLGLRGADISGTSVRGELGAIFQPDDKTPLTLDLNLTGFAGKKRGLSGGLSALWHF